MSPFGSPCDRASARAARHSGSGPSPLQVAAGAGGDGPGPQNRFAGHAAETARPSVFTASGPVRKNAVRAVRSPYPCRSRQFLITLSSALSSSWFQHRTFGQCGVPWGGALDETASQVFVRTASKLAEEKRDLAPGANPGEDPSHSAA